MFILNKKGISLVEVLVSALIISFVLVGIILIFVQTLDISNRVNLDYTALNLARSRLERARTVQEAGGFNSLQDLYEADTLLDSSGNPDTDGSFKRSTTVTTNYSGNARLTMVVTEVVYKYRTSWRTGASSTLTTVFVNME